MKGFLGLKRQLVVAESQIAPAKEPFLQMVGSVRLSLFAQIALKCAEKRLR